MKKILTIAGYDPSSGAGITEDMEVFHSLGFHGLSAPTAMVIQGPEGVKKVYPTPLIQFREILHGFDRDFTLQGVKIGVLYDKTYIQAIVAFLKKKRNIPVVVDPVFSSKNGVELIKEPGITTVKRSLFPMATMITPNTVEATRLCNVSIENLKDMERAAAELIKSGPRAVVIKGGHLKGNPTDLFYDGKRFLYHEKKRIDREVHGTGCFFSSLLTSFLAHGYSPPDAFFASEERMEKSLLQSYRIENKSYYYMSPSIRNGFDAERWEVISSLRIVKEELLTRNPVELVPEVGMNLGYALKQAESIQDVAAFPGRIRRYHEKILIGSDPLFGASSHVARMILAFMRRHPRIRACANIKYNETYLRKAEAAKMRIVFFDRAKEPDIERKTEGKSLDFIIDQALKRTTFPPDIIYDKGSTGKEAMIRIFAENPIQLIQKMEIIRP